jgi:hypothetical protein
MGGVGSTVEPTVWLCGSAVLSQLRMVFWQTRKTFAAGW